MQRIGDIEIEQDIAFESAFWKVQRIAWIIMALIVVLAFLGFFGGAGIFASANTEQGELTVTYPRFARYIAPAAYIVSVEDVSEETVRISISSSLVHVLEISSITPEPASVVEGTNEVTYEFESSGDGQFTATFNFKTNDFGFHTGTIRSADAEVPVSLFVYP